MNPRVVHLLKKLPGPGFEICLAKVKLLHLFIDSPGNFRNRHGQSVMVDQILRTGFHRFLEQQISQSGLSLYSQRSQKACPRIMPHRHRVQQRTVHIEDNAVNHSVAVLLIHI